MGRELPPADDVGVIWFGHGVHLARQIQAFIERWHGRGRDTDILVGELHEVLHAELDLLERLPDLGMPPEPAWARNADPMRGAASEPGS
ncbi:MAG: hypothetical protein ABW046_20480 [Actinoplanes sp.]